MSDPASISGLPFDVSSWDRLHRPIWLYDHVLHRGLYANAPALALWGADSLDELLARDFSRLSPAVLSRLARLALATADGATVSERWSFYPKGKPVTVQAIISSLTLENSRTALLFEAEPVALERNELRAVEALRHTSSMISLFDQDGCMTFSNPAAFAAYGDGARSFSDRFPSPQEGRAAFAEVLEGRIMAELRQVRTAHGDRSHYLDARWVTDPVTGHVGVLLSERDVTAQVEAEQAMRAAQDRAEIAEAKQRFLANISHELRTPLNSVIGFAGLLRDSGLDPVQTDHLQRISGSAETLLRAINDIIDLSELSAGSLSLRPAAFDPAALVKDVLGAMAPAASAKGLDLDLELPEAPTSHLIGDAQRLNTVVAHFLSNAVKFTQQGGVVLGLRCDSDGTDSATLEITVRDTGPGLDEATQARLFRRFSQGDDSTRKRTAGAGLGLAIAKELITLMGGEVGVNSTPGQGACFWLRLTLPVPGDDGAMPIQEAQDEDRALTILYADDHEANRVLVQTLLRSQGHLCDTVEDGAQAVTAVRSGFYDLVLMDIQMPVQDGVSATLDIRAGARPQSEVPIVALTANTLSAQRDTYSAAGLDDCIAKPVNPAELFTKVAYWASANARGGRPAEKVDRGAIA